MHTALHLWGCLVVDSCISSIGMPSISPSVGLPCGVIGHKQDSHAFHFSLGPRDSLPSPQLPVFACVPPAYAVADPEYSGCSTHYRQTLGTMETSSPYRWNDSTYLPA